MYICSNSCGSIAGLITPAGQGDPAGHDGDRIVKSFPDRIYADILRRDQPVVGEEAEGR